MQDYSPFKNMALPCDLLYEKESGYKNEWGTECSNFLEYKKLQFRRCLKGAEINVFRHFYISLKISIAQRWPEGWKQGGHVFGFCIPSNKSRLGIPKLWIWNYFHRVRHDFTNQNNPKYVVLTMHSEKPKRFEFDSSWHPSDATSLLIDYLL